MWDVSGPRQAPTLGVGRFLLIAGAALAASASLVEGRVWTVAPNGSDAGPGTAEQPLATFQAAVDRVAPGDVVEVESGRFAGCRIERSGRADAWITLRPAPGAAVVVDRPGPVNRHGSAIELETWEGDGVVAYWVVEGLEVTGAPGWGIDARGSAAAPSHHLTIRHNLVHHNGLDTEKTGIFTAFVDRARIEGNETHSNGEHGIYHSNSGDLPIIRGNLSHHNAACGIHVNADASQGGDGMVSEAVIEGNVIWENGREGCSAINLDGVERSLLRNNLIFDNHAGGISIYRTDGALCSRGNRVLFNTILMADDGRWAINVTERSCEDNELAGNVILTRHPWRGSVSLAVSDVRGFASDRNVVADRFSVDDGDDVIDLGAWRALGYDLRSVTSSISAVFVDPGSGDLDLAPDSPARGLAELRADALLDAAGRARGRGGIADAGALEARRSSDVSGCVDLLGEPMVDRRVVVRQGGTKEKPRSDESGCFAVGSLDAEARVTVVLRGPRVAAGGEVGGCFRRDGEAWAEADLLVREKGGTSYRLDTDGDGCFEVEDLAGDGRVTIRVRSSG